MRKMTFLLSLWLTLTATALLGTSTVLASELKTITLSVDKMTCSMCPITVKKALRKVEGVTVVSAKYEGNGVGWAKVTYDPRKADVEDLTFATEQAGYPSRLQP
ncbi:MAG TPA: mercuric transport protein periplasmic component [Gammaproteobacteria bacterium]|nr:mercuric transport protein periplasmic component [Gammaproteobacteria bacterium]